MKNVTMHFVFILLASLMVTCDPVEISHEDLNRLVEKETGKEQITISHTHDLVKYVPYKESGVLTPTGNPESDLDVECEVGSFEVLNEKSAIVSHLGKISGFENSCVNFETGQVIVKGKNIAANGDLLYFEANCGFTSPTDFTCDLTITGGTGRFENAHNPPGEPIIVKGTFDPLTGESRYQSAGRISSIGSK